MKSIPSLLKIALAILAGAALSSCGTIAGFGHDVHKAGRAIERTANS
ncbi:entericidin A/B family lipoprotein [Luteolibacter sp. LG18]|nr:hypothetical protein llg_09990 [Luteolibacter sp. LG18]